MKDMGLRDSGAVAGRRVWLAVVAVTAAAGPLLFAGEASAACVAPLNPLVPPAAQLSLTCQTSNGGSPTSSSTYVNNVLPAVPGSFFYGHSYGGPTMPIEGPPPPGFGFYDDYVFTIGLSTVNSITSTIDLGTLQVSNLQVRLYSLVDNSLPTLGVPTGTVYSAWSTAISGPPASGTYAVIDPTVLAAGTYVLEVRGNVTGANGGSYSGTLNLQPVPLPAAAWLLISGLGVLGAAARRRR